MSNIAMRNKKLLFTDDITGQVQVILDFEDRMHNFSGVTLIPGESGGESLVEKFTAFFQLCGPQNERTFTRSALTFLLSGLVAGRLLSRGQTAPILSIAKPEAFYYDIFQGILRLFSPYAPYYRVTLGADVSDDVEEALARTVLGKEEDNEATVSAAVEAYVTSLTDNGFTVVVLDERALGEKPEWILRSVSCRIRPGGLLLVSCSPELAMAPFWDVLFPGIRSYNVDAETRLLCISITVSMQENAQQEGMDAVVYHTAGDGVEQYVKLEAAIKLLLENDSEEGSHVLEEALSALHRLEQSLFRCYDNLENPAIVSCVGDLKNGLLNARFPLSGSLESNFQQEWQESWEIFSQAFQLEFEVFFSRNNENSGNSGNA